MEKKVKGENITLRKNKREKIVHGEKSKGSNSAWRKEYGEKIVH